MMDNLEAIFWLAIMQQSKEGDAGATDMLTQANEVRAELGQPTVEEEMAEVANRAK